MYIEYLNYPPIPEHLVESVDTIINRENFEKDWTYENYVTKPLSAELTDWLLTNLDIELERQPLYQVLRNVIPMHKDTDGRPYAYNYLLYTGGDRVTTSFYDDNKKLVYSEKVLLDRCHRLSTQNYHSVVGFDSKSIRISITLTPKFTW
jgi:hypothetical protein